MKYPFFSKSAASPWPWPPTCVVTPQTLSFRANDTVYRTVNSTYLDDGDVRTAAEFTNSFGTTSDCNDQEDILPSEFDESAVIRGLRSNRLIFRPGESSSILEEAKTIGSTPYHDGFSQDPSDAAAATVSDATDSKHPSDDAASVSEAMNSKHPSHDAVSIPEATDSETPYDDDVSVLAMDSDDPYADFRSSMAEMVASHDLKDWEALEELLACYLRVNLSDNHGFIVAAFADLLIHLACRHRSPAVSSSSAIDEHCSSSSTQNFSFTSPLSFSSSSTSPRPSSPENEDPIAAVHKTKESRRAPHHPADEMPQ